MAVTAGMLARAAATALSNEKLRKGIGWGLVAVLSPVILLIAALCSIGTGGADHNNQAVAAAFYGTSYSTEVPMAFRSHIEEMRSAFSLLDSAVASVNGRTEGGNSLDPIRVKAVFYALCFGEDAPGRRAANRFVECFYTWETRTRTVEVENEDGTVTNTTEEYTVAVPVSLYQAYTVEDASIYDLHHLYFDLKRLIMLMDGQFYPITSVTQDGVEITTSIQKKLLPNYFSADFMIGENNRLINFDEVLSETLFSNWCLIQEELDIVHNTALYCLSRVEMPVDMKCAFLIEAFIGVGEIIQSKKSEFVLPKRKSREKSQLGLDLKYIISHYGQEIFRGEYQKDLEGFVQILVNSRNRIAHIKSKQNRKFLNGDESVLYLHKLSLMYRIILLDLLDIPLNRYKERLSNRIETINCWWADRCDQ